MGKTDADFQATTTATTADGPPPPPYTEAPDGSHEQAETLRGLEAQTPAGPMTSPYWPFPSIMGAYYQWKMTGTFHLGESPDQRLYAVSVHTGWSLNGRGGPGVVLHNGPTNKDPRLATAGEESRWHNFSLNSIITLPSLPGSPQETCTEIMRAGTDQKTVKFQFSIEVGHGKELRREEFVWQTVSKGEEAKKLADAPFEAGFKLIRASDRTGGSGGTASKEAEGDLQEVLAVFAWNRSLSITKPFRIQFTGDHRTAVMGERWALMVVITGLRLWGLKHQGRVNPRAVASVEAGTVNGAVG